MNDPTGDTEKTIEADEGVEERPDAVEPESLGEAEGLPDTPPWLPSPAQVHRYKDAGAIADAAAKRFLDSAKRAVDKSDRFIVVLAGGSTPRALYRRLTEPPYRESVPWKRTCFVFGDERCVSPDDETSNYRSARETLLEPLEISQHRVLRMKGEQVPAEAARRYEVRLNDLFLNHPRRKFNLVLLGIGADGHTASLFPGTAALEERERWVVANQVPQLDDAWRLTMTFKALNATRRVILMATGEEKAQVIAEAFGGLEHAEPHPCERVAPLHARREVLIDHAAASRIPREESAAEESAGRTDDSREKDEGGNG
ncbi:MAG: 6-phosphogluconolactonase [Planctomycetota bacterium]|jgi:6-phosphogluconolactonase